MENKKKQISLYITDVNFDSVSNLLKWLDEHYEIKWVKNDPDFIIHSCFDHQVLKYNGVRVAWLGENVQPDFNISDYGMGFSRIDFQERYLRIPLYRWYFNEYESLFNESRNVKKINGRKELLKKKLFCTMVVSNSGRGSFFKEILYALSQYKMIDSGGKWNNNIGGPVSQKLPFIKQGKFHLAFENSSTPGYVTEKILHAFSAHTVPIYWGAPDVVKDFNPKAFINCHDFETVEQVIDEVRRLDGDDSAYSSMLEEPLFVGGTEPEWLSKKEIMSWITQVFDQSLPQAYRRNRHYWGRRYQQELKTAFFSPQIQFAKLTYRSITRMFRKDRIS